VRVQLPSAAGPQPAWLPPACPTPRLLAACPATAVNAADEEKTSGCTATTCLVRKDLVGAAFAAAAAAAGDPRALHVLALAHRPECSPAIRTAVGWDWDRELLHPAPPQPHLPAPALPALAPLHAGGGGQRGRQPSGAVPRRAGS
jgi:hypothetical protein